jgi:hypothetical protein
MLRLRLTKAEGGWRIGNGIPVWTRLCHCSRLCHDHASLVDAQPLDAMHVFENLPDLEDMDLVVDLVQPN